MDLHPEELLTIERLLERLTLTQATIHLESPSVEIITLEQFAERMQVGETTVWKWIRSGKLRPGRHYIQIERVIRFHWCRALVERLLEDCQEGGDEETAVVSDEPAAPQFRKRHRYGSRINFDI